MAAVLGLLTVVTGCLGPPASVTLRVDLAALEDVRGIGRVRAEFAHESDTEGGGTQISETMIIDVGGMNGREALDRAANLLAARDWMIEAENRPTIIGMASARWKDTYLELRPYHPAYFEDHPEVLEKIKKESIDSSSLVYLDVSSLNVSRS
ncbi:hypothetical protein [Nonomuraea cavernae]|uniref:hypothetical protein n=1 Tax=Nonomuraea cavernae TaxID=2045107 RepID=UPI0033C47BE7